jgi:hypothetical protein
MGLQFSAPHLVGDVAQAGRFAGAETSANVLRIVEGRTASVLLVFAGTYLLYTIAVGLHREFFTAKSPIQHNVLHRDERAPPAAATPAADAEAGAAEAGAAEAAEAEAAEATVAAAAL